MVSLKDVAEDTGLSVGTVSQILHRNDARYNAKTRRNVRAAAKRLGYQPNRAARALATGRTNVVGVYMRVLYTAFNSWVLRHLGQNLDRAGYHLSARPTLQGGDLHRDTTADAQWPVDMAIYLDCGPGHPTCPAPETGGPYVSIGAYPDKTRDWIQLDLYAGTMAALEHLHSHGHRSIGYLLNFVPEDGEVQREPRLAAYEDFVKEAGLERRYVVTPDLTPADARNTVRECAEAGNLPEALFCHFDEVALGAYRGLVDAGVRVPDDVALLGCDGLEMLEYLECPMTTIEMPVREMCSKTVDFALNRVKNPEAPPMTLTMSPRLRIRQSTTGVRAEPPA